MLRTIIILALHRKSNGTRGACLGSQNENGVELLPLLVVSFAVLFPSGLSGGLVTWKDQLRVCCAAGAARLGCVAFLEKGPRRITYFASVVPRTRERRVREPKCSRASPPIA